MAELLLFNRVWETTNTVGTGAATLLGPKSGYQTFAVIGNGNTCPYCITDGVSFEVGMGTYSTIGPSLSRDTVFASSNSNNLVNFGAGTKQIFLPAPAELLTQINVENTFRTAEPISGGRAVGFNTSGTVQIAMAGVPSRMPAFGVVVDNTVSGALVRVYNRARLNSSLFDFSGYIGSQVWVGNSGELIVSGAPSASGDIQQTLGIATSHSGMMIGAIGGGNNNVTIISSGAILESGSVTSGKIGDNAVTSGNIASGAIGSPQLAAEAVQSGNIASGAINSFNLSSGVVRSGHIGDAAVSSGNIASGAIGWPHLASGAARSGNIGGGAISSGNIASGQVGWPHLASGAARSGNVGDSAISSGNIASGQISTPHFASGAIIDTSQFSIDNTFITAEMVSGVKAVGFDLSGNLQIAKAGTSGKMPAFGIVIDNVASGQPATVYRNGRVFSSQVDFSGYHNQLIYVGTSGDMLVSGAPSASGDVQQIIGMVITDSGMMLGQPLGLTAGNNITFTQGNGTTIITAVGSSLTSGSVQSGNIGDAAVTSGNIASGQISSPHLASGTIVDISQWSIDNTFITSEMISGVKAVGFNLSGQLEIAKAGTNGKMPAFGVVVDNVASGTLATVYRNGRVFNTNLNFSGYHNQLIYVGTSGDLVVSGAPSASGDVVQIIGMVITDSGMMLGQPLGITAGNNITFTQGNGAIIINSTSSGGGGLTSGSVQSGNIAANAVTSGNIASGQIGWAVLTNTAYVGVVSSGEGQTYGVALYGNGLSGSATANVLADHPSLASGEVIGVGTVSIIIQAGAYFYIMEPVWRS